MRPKWVNPCGGVLEDVSIDPDAPPLTDAEIAANTILEVDLALNQIRSFKDDFVSAIISSSQFSFPCIFGMCAATVCVSDISWDRVGSENSLGGRAMIERNTTTLYLYRQVLIGGKTRIFSPEKERDVHPIPRRMATAAGM